VLKLLVKFEIRSKVMISLSPQFVCMFKPGFGDIKKAGAKRSNLSRFEVIIEYVFKKSQQEINGWSLTQPSQNPAVGNWAALQTN